MKGRIGSVFASRQTIRSASNGQSGCDSAVNEKVLLFRRLTTPDEDGLIRVAVHAKNDAVAASVEVYTSQASLTSLAESLMTFPERIPSAASFTAASGSCQLTIELETVGSAGHVAIRMRMESGDTRFTDTAVLWLRSEPASLIRLGHDLRSVASLDSVAAQLPE